MKIDIKICFIGYLPNYNPLNGQLFTNAIISSKYNFIIDQVNPDFVFVGSYGDMLANFVAYKDKVKIWYIEEPFSPDFVFFDYCIGFDPYDFGGRNIFYPDCLHGMTIPPAPTIFEAYEITKSKELFCSMIFAHETHDGMRAKYYRLLSKYKRVESAGSFMNNQEDNKTVDYTNGDSSKFELQKKCKFDLCIQTLKFDWFINEKIVHAIINNTIPIFYGTSKVKQIFNPKRFIFVNDFESDEDLLKRIKEIDNDDKLFAAIISEPPFTRPNLQKEVLEKAFLSLDSIFSGGTALRRNLLYSPQYLYNDLTAVSRWNSKRKKGIRRFFSKIATKAKQLFCNFFKKKK